MTTHVLDDNTDQSSYFGRQNRHGRAAYRRAVIALTGSLPLWAKDRRGNVTTTPSVTTLPVVSTSPVSLNVTTIAIEDLANLSCEDDRFRPGYIDPLTLINP